MGCLLSLHRRHELSTSVESSDSVCSDKTILTYKFNRSNRGFQGITAYDRDPIQSDSE